MQENGSYRTLDMVEALEWCLPDAADSTESIIVLLDWFSAHRSDEVAAVIRRKGHVLVFHGGGVTPFIQINDTHLHALVARILVALENAWAHSQRTAAEEAGRAQPTPSPKRVDILELVQAMWVQINHSGVAQKGYRQTGPELPMEGPWDRNDIFPDLLKVFDKLDPDSAMRTDGQVSTAIRDDAVAFVDSEWEAGRLTSWADAPNLIEEHDDEDEPVEEGLEAYSYDPSDNSSGGETSDTDEE